MGACMESACQVRSIIIGVPTAWVVLISGPGQLLRLYIHSGAWKGHCLHSQLGCIKFYACGCCSHGNAVSGWVQSDSYDNVVAGWDHIANVSGVSVNSGLWTTEKWCISVHALPMQGLT